LKELSRKLITSCLSEELLQSDFLSLKKKKKKKKKKVKEIFRLTILRLVEINSRGRNKK
jgi:hypothetical protein